MTEEQRKKAVELLKEAYKDMLDLANGHINYWWTKDKVKGKILHNKLDCAGKKFDQALVLFAEPEKPECDNCPDSLIVGGVCGTGNEDGNTACTRPKEHKAGEDKNKANPRR